MNEAPRSKSASAERPRPYLEPQYCKGCGRCIGACPKDCIAYDDHVDTRSGVVPVVVDLEACNGCGLCLGACPEPWGLQELLPDGSPPAHGEPGRSVEPAAIPDQCLPLPEQQPMALKGAHAAAIGAMLAGCRNFYGYPITPSTEGAELMARLLPRLGGHFVQAVSEVAAVNYLYGAGGAGMRAMTFTSSPGFSLMLEGISYMIGAEIPTVIANIMRGGPGLGNISPEQSDIKLVCRGLGHGHTHAIALAPASPQEMLELTMLAFDLAFKYRNPVILLGDGFVGQTTGTVRLPPYFVQPGVPSWAVRGDAEHRHNLMTSIHLAEPDLEAHMFKLLDKYAEIGAREQRAELYQAEDAEVLIVACNTPARMAKGAVEALRARGVAAGLFRPITLWPFPIAKLLPLLEGVQKLVVVEASAGQLEDELRLALSKAEAPPVPIEHIRRVGGFLPQLDAIVEHVLETEEVPS
ncbi:MAG TPA: 3-methyl-2-oxobutanoate dehydrogenase subunit VorB [Thermoanaerobaculia bacterium]|nr:3-methyl-2-oxobutanoate dehydrogenase subunit VorB [Thermoanaerobaculia bacterium]